MFPASTEAYDTLEAVKDSDTPAVMREWWEHMNNADPYTVVMGGNIEDGMSVGLGLPPKRRGQHTVPWPFKREHHGS